MKFVYNGARSKLRHRGRTHAEYVFQKGQPVVVDDKEDVAFFKGKCEKNPSTWKIYDPKRRAPKKAPAEEPPEEEGPEEEETVEEPPAEETPKEDPKPKAPAMKEAEK